MKWIQATGDSQAVRIFQLKDESKTFVLLRYYPSIRQIVLNYNGKEEIFSLRNYFLFPDIFTCRNEPGSAAAKFWIENKQPGAGRIMVNKNIFTFRLTGQDNNISLLFYKAQIRLPFLQCNFGLSAKKKEEKFLFAAMLFGLGIYISDPLAQKITRQQKPALTIA
jgi:hypothetical protein